MELEQTRSLRNGGLALALMMSAAGCWPASGAGPGRQSYNSGETAINVESVDSMAEEWHVSFGVGPVSNPVRGAGGPIYVVATDASHGSRSVYAINSDGSLRWELDGQVNGTDQGYDGELVLAGAELGVSTYATGTTDQRWHHQWVDAKTTEPVGPVWRGRLEARRGPIALAFGENGASDPQPFSLYGHQLEGWDGWGGYVGSDVAPTLGTDSHYQSGYGMTNDSFPPVFGNGVRGYPNVDQGTNCVLDYMCPSWAVPIDGQTATPVVLAPGEETVYTVTDVGTVYALGDDGVPRWTASVGSSVSHPPGLAEGWLYVPTDDGRLVVFAADGCGAPTCAPAWEASTGSRVSAQPAIGGDVVFTGSADGSVDAFAATGCAAATCTPLWSAELGSEITGAPAVTGGQLYVGTADGRLVAYGP